MNNFIQVPVINKTEAIFERDPNNSKIVLQELNPLTKTLFETEEHIVTVKTDGTCAIILKLAEGQFSLMRRQDIKVGSRNFESVMNNGQIIDLFGTKCYLTQIVRGSGKGERTVPFYVIQLDENDKPEIEVNHCIGFTPLLEKYGEDKFAITAINRTNGETGMKLWTTVFEGSPDVNVKCLDVTEIMGSKNIMTVELMGSKIAAKYGFTDNRHFINPHGSIVFPKELLPKIDYESLKQWFLNDESNRWANVEGIVVHFPQSNRRFKLHRGHVGLEKTWFKKKESGLKFIFEEN